MAKEARVVRGRMGEGRKGGREGCFDHIYTGCPLCSWTRVGLTVFIVHHLANLFSLSLQMQNWADFGTRRVHEQNGHPVVVRELAVAAGERKKERIR